MARDLINHPGSEATPAYLARTARRIAKAHDLRCKVLDEKGIKKLGMGALLAVGQGSANKPRFIALEHGPLQGAPLVFVGKGITFDSGGLSLNSSIVHNFYATASFGLGSIFLNFFFTTNKFL